MKLTIGSASGPYTIAAPSAPVMVMQMMPASASIWPSTFSRMAREYQSIALQTRESGSEARTGACAYVESMKNLIAYDIASTENIAVEAPANAEWVSTSFASSGLFANNSPSANSPVDSVTYAARVPTITRKPLMAAYVLL